MNPDTEKVYNTAFDLIEVRLGRKEQVHPFVVTISKDNDSPEMSMYEPVGQDTAEQIGFMREDIRKKIKKKQIIALCICYDVKVIDPRTTQETDAVKIELAGNKIETMDIYVPYDLSHEEVIKKPFQTTSDQVYF